MYKGLRDAWKSSAFAGAARNGAATTGAALSTSRRDAGLKAVQLAATESTNVLRSIGIARGSSEF